MNDVTRIVPKPLNHEELQRMIDDQIHVKKVEYGDGHDLNLAVLDDLSLYIISDFDFSRLNLSGIRAYKTTFHQCRFAGADLYHSFFDETVAPGADFQGAVMVKSVLTSADLRGANFDGANLIRAEFMHCDLRGATFHNVDLETVFFLDCKLEGVASDAPIESQQ